MRFAALAAGYSLSYRAYLSRAATRFGGGPGRWTSLPPLPLPPPLTTDAILPALPGSLLCILPSNACEYKCGLPYSTLTPYTPGIHTYPFSPGSFLHDAFSVALPAPIRCACP